MDDEPNEAQVAVELLKMRETMIRVLHETAARLRDVGVDDPWPILRRVWVADLERTRQGAAWTR